MPHAARSVALLLLSSLGCSRGDRTPAAPGVLLVVADTLRADKLGCYGHPGGLTPVLDAWSRKAVRFEDASAHAPWTLPSVASLLTGHHPARHAAGGRLGEFRPLGPELPTLAELFREQGYATAAIANVPFLAAPFGLERGFEHVDAELHLDNVAVRTAARTTDAALSWLRALDPGTPFLLLVHYFDPHAVYDPPAPHRARHAPEEAGSAALFWRREEVVRCRLEGRTPAPERIRRAERLYDGEVAYLDAELGRLLAALAGPDLGRTVVVFTADHGEEFLDHDGFEHGHTLYQELLAVPLLLSAPGLAPANVADPVRLIDVAPTVLELAGLPVPGGLAGHSLLPLLRGEENAPRPVLAQGNFWGEPWTALRQGDHKLIRRPNGRAELFELTTDPDERHDLAGERPALVAEMLAHMAALERAEAPGTEAEPPVLDEGQRALLESLGYAGD